MNTPLKEALAVYEKRESMTEFQKLDAAKRLGGLGFSATQIAAITGLSKPAVLKVVNKKDKTGGRLRPEALGLLAELTKLRSKGLIDVFVAKRIRDHGVSKYTVNKLTGMPASTFDRWVQKADVMTMEGEKK